MLSYKIKHTEVTEPGSYVFQLLRHECYVVYTCIFISY